MQRDEILRKLEEIVPAIQASSDAEGTLLKFATEHNLSPAQLEAVAQVYNTGRALTFYAKSASRGATFKLVNTEPLLEKYTDHCKKAGLEPVVATTKSASATIVEGGRFPHHRQITEGYETLEKAASVKDEIDTWVQDKLAQMRQSDSAREAIKTAEEIKASALDDIREKLGELRDSVRFNKEAFTSLEEDAHDIWTLGEWKTVFNTMAGYLKSAGCDVDGYRYDETKKANRAVARDTTGMLKLAEEVRDQISFIRAADEFMEDIKQASKGLKDPPKTRDKKTRDKKTRDKGTGDDEDMEVNPSTPPVGGRAGVQEQADDSWTPDANTPPIGGSRKNPVEESLIYSAPTQERSKEPSLLKSLMEGVDSPGLKAPPVKSPLTAGASIITSVYDGKNRRQQKRDDAVAEDNTTTALQRLMVTDPILAEASPEDVIQHFNTINEIAPSLATDPQKLKLVLREAVSYGSIPMHTLKELLEIEKLVIGNNQAASKTRSDMYGPSGIFKRP